MWPNSSNKFGSQISSRPSMPESQSSQDTPGPTAGHLEAVESKESSNLILPSKKAPSKQKQWVPPFLIDSWTLECLAMVIAFAALLAIIVILISYNEKLLNDWPYSIQLNTVLSTLATVFKGFLLMPVCTSLCQLKWLWYTKKPKSLYDFQLFDLASRGPWGAVQLIYHLNAWHMASIGSIIILLSLTSDAFIQQTVSYPRRDNWITESSPSVPYLQVFDQYISPEGEASYTTQPLMAALYNGVYASDLSLSTSAIRAKGCGSGNCTFPSYASLGVCSKCADVSMLFNYTFEPNTGLGSSESFDLPNGHSLHYGRSSTVLVNITSHIASEAETRIVDPRETLNTDELYPYLSPLSILTATIITVSPVEGEAPYAHDCVLSFCARSYEASETLGTFEETTLDLFDQLSTSIGNFTEVQGAYTFTVPSTLLTTIGDRNRTFMVDEAAKRALQNAISQEMQGITGTHVNGVLISESTVSQAFYFNGGQRIVQTMENLASALTNAMRTSSNGTTVTGKMFTETTYISVQWWWLILPLVIQVLGAVFLAATMWRTRKSKVPNWRSSALAIMEHGTKSWGKHGNQGTGAHDLAAEGREKVSELEQWADGLNVNLRRRGATRRGYGLEPAEDILPVHQEGIQLSPR